MPAKKATAPKKTASKKAPPKKPAAPKAPSFGRPGTAGKAEGDAAVQAWIAAVKPEHRPLVQRLDALLAEGIPDVKRSIKWSMPFYGREGQGWIAHVASFKSYVSLGFFAGTGLTPPPPIGESETMRKINIPSIEELDERQVRTWIAQAAKLQGWAKV